MLTDSNNLGDVGKTLVEVKYANFLALLRNLYFVLLLYRSVIDEYRVPFLNLDKAGMFVNSLPHNWVSLMMLLHQHQ